MKILHIITSMNKGGAENFLYKLSLQSNKNNNIEIFIITLLKFGYYENLLRQNNIKIYSLDIRNKYFIFLKIKKLINLIKSINPDVIQTWMYHSNLIGGLAAKFIGTKKIIWTIRHGKLIFFKSKITTILINYLSMFFSKLIPTKIVYCSYSSKKIHENFGYNKNISRVIYNGFNFDEFIINKKSKKKIRNKFKIKDDEFIISMIARFNKQKSHDLFFKSLYNLKKKSNFEFKILLAGSNICYKNKKLFKMIKKLNLNNNIILLGYINDLNEIYNSSDLLILPSKYGESFPNVIAEAMMCGVRCISSDIGEAKNIINDYGVIIRDVNHKSLYTAINDELKKLKILDKSQRENLSLMSRQHIKKNYNIIDISNEYIDLWLKKNLI